MTILDVDPGVLLYGVRVDIRAHWAAIFFGTVGLVVWGSGEGKGRFEEREAKVRREARQRCLDEIVAFSNGKKIINGIGADVIRAHLLSRTIVTRMRMDPEDLNG